MTVESEVRAINKSERNLSGMKIRKLWRCQNVDIKR